LFFKIFNTDTGGGGTGVGVTCDNWACVFDAAWHATNEWGKTMPQVL